MNFVLFYSSASNPRSAYTELLETPALPILSVLAVTLYLLPRSSQPFLKENRMAYHEIKPLYDSPQSGHFTL